MLEIAPFGKFHARTGQLPVDSVERPDDQRQYKPQPEPAFGKGRHGHEPDEECHHGNEVWRERSRHGKPSQRVFDRCMDIAGRPVEHALLGSRERLVRGLRRAGLVVDARPLQRHFPSPPPIVERNASDLDPNEIALAERRPQQRRLHIPIPEVIGDRADETSLEARYPGKEAVGGDPLRLDRPFFLIPPQRNRRTRRGARDGGNGSFVRDQALVERQDIVIVGNECGYAFGSVRDFNRAVFAPRPFEGTGEPGRHPLHHHDHTRGAGPAALTNLPVHRRDAGHLDCGIGLVVSAIASMIGV